MSSEMAGTTSPVDTLALSIMDDSGSKLRKRKHEDGEKDGEEDIKFAQRAEAWQKAWRIWWAAERESEKLRKQWEALETEYNKAFKLWQQHCAETLKLKAEVYNEPGTGPLGPQIPFETIQALGGWKPCGGRM